MSAPRLGAWVEYRAEDGVPLTATRSEIGGSVVVSVWPRFTGGTDVPPRIEVYNWLVNEGPNGIRMGSALKYQDAKRDADDAAKDAGWTWEDARVIRVPLGALIEPTWDGNALVGVYVNLRGCARADADAFIRDVAPDRHAGARLRHLKLAGYDVILRSRRSDALEFLPWHDRRTPRASIVPGDGAVLPGATSSD